jgi:hypothetical protein
MRVYIAGPMRNLPQFNFPAFNAAADEWRCAGWDVISPAEIDQQQDGFDGTNREKEPTFEVAMRRDIEAILTCDAIAFLPGWERSEGSRIEYTVAKAVGLELLDAVTHDLVDDSFIYDEKELLTCLRK